MGEEIIEEIDNEFEVLQKAYAEKEEEKKGVNIEHLKPALKAMAERLRELTVLKAEHDVKIDRIQEAITATLTEIRNAWLPFIAGATEATIDLGGDLVLQAKPVLNIGVEDEKTSIDWFKENGYESVMKYQIHNQTLKKIAREHYLKGEVIPGLKYSTFELIKLK